MVIIIAVLFLLATGPLLSIGALIADAHSGGPRLSPRRLVASAMTGSVLLATPAGCQFSVLPHATGAALPLGVAFGAAYGLAAGLVAVALRRARAGRGEHRDRPT